MNLEEAKKLKRSTRPIWVKSESSQIRIDSRKVSGYAASFNNIDSVYDVLVRGCFSKSIQEHGVNSTSAQKIVMLWSHDMKNPIGRFTKLEEDANGLYFEAEIDPIEQGDRLLIQYQTGTINQHSIGFDYIWDKCDWGDWKGEQAFICNELRLMEISPVSIGANENTPFLGFKSTDEVDTYRKDLIKRTERFINSFDYSKQLEIRNILKEHLSLAESLQPNLKSLQAEAKPIDFVVMSKHFSLT